MYNCHGCLTLLFGCLFVAGTLWFDGLVVVYLTCLTSQFVYHVQTVEQSMAVIYPVCSAAVWPG